MIDNVVILTSGLSGSSVVAGLLEKGGYWTGHTTMRKPDYDTKENADLVGLNSQLLKVANWEKNYTTEFSRDYICEMSKYSYEAHKNGMDNFLELCDAHQPWVWKDPRLLLTIRLWQDHLAKRNVKYVLLTRDPIQSWISTTKRRQIQSLAQSNAYLRNTKSSYLDFLGNTGASYLQLVYENLLRYPETEINRINDFLETNISTADLVDIYNGTLFKKPNSLVDGVLATMIYLKNRAR